MDKHSHISFAERLRYEGLVLAEAARLKGQAELLGNLDEEITSLAREQFLDERDFVFWLVTPSQRLEGITPLAALGSEGGRQSVVAWLNQMAGGGYI